MGHFFYSILREFDIAVLQRNAPMEYTFLGEQPKYYKEVFPEDENGKPCITPWEYSLMLELFVETAEQFFVGNSEGSVSSGVWQEECIDSEILLIALAMKVDDSNLLVILNLSSFFPNHLAMIQKARENLLYQNSLSKSLDFYKKKSSYDDLTSLYNRGTFMEILSRGISDGSFSSMNVSIIMIDIDDFKKVNDTYGHMEGDNVLQALGGILNSILRAGDIAARYGGEGFIILATNTTLKQAGRLGEKIRVAVQNYPFENMPKVTISLGGSAYRGGECIDDCIKRADLALYDSKRSGKNMIRLR